MIKNPVRIYGYGHLHFITFSCYRRKPLLGTVCARNLFAEVLDAVRDRHGFALAGYVVMPEHAHLLIGEPRVGTPSTVLQVLKQCVSRELHPALRTQASARSKDEAKPLPRFWQRRFYDFNVWSLKKRTEKLHYMHMDPVKRGLVAHPKDWPWSSFSFYARSEPVLIRIDPVR